MGIGERWEVNNVETTPSPISSSVSDPDSLNPDPDPGILLNSDLYPWPWFCYDKRFVFLNPEKDFQAPEEASSPTENSLNMKLLIFCLFWGDSLACLDPDPKHSSVGNLGRFFIVC